MHACACVFCVVGARPVDVFRGVSGWLHVLGYVFVCSYVGV